MTVTLTQGRVYAVVSDPGNLKTTQARGLVTINFPTDELKNSQTELLVAAQGGRDILISQANVLVAIRGRSQNRYLRAWTFSMDGHDFYVVRLGEEATLVYDLTTGQWTKWTTLGRETWRATVGMNWIGMGRKTVSLQTEGSAPAESQVVAGDDTFGMLWTLAPTQGYDVSPYNDTQQVGFPRVVVGGVPLSMRETKPLGAAYLTASFGTPQISGANILLRTSDDFGKTWTSHGTVTVEPGNYSQEFVWRSLGLMKAPGRIFEISDEGATVRIDGLEIR